MEDKVRSYLCLEKLQSCIQLPGNVAECGIAFGQTTFILDPLVKQHNKLLYAFDTFAGLPYDDSIACPYQCKQGEMNYGKQFFEQLQQHPNSSIVPVIGLVEETLQQYAKQQFCFVFLDLDLYKPTSYAYRFFEDRIVPGGMIGFHDYRFARCPGVEIVVDKEVDYSKYEVADDASMCLFIRRKAQ